MQRAREWDDAYQLVVNGDVRSVRAMLERSPEYANTPMDAYGHLPLSVACLYSQQEVAKTLLEFGARAEAAEWDGSTALHSTPTACDQHPLMLRLLAHGANPRCQTRRGWTPLHQAASRGRTQCCRVLLEAGADPNARDTEGMTPLHGLRTCTTVGRSNSGWFHEAAGDPNGVVETLLAFGANPAATDNTGKRPIDYVSFWTGRDAWRALRRTGVCKTNA
jgi:hypothetical protein